MTVLGAVVAGLVASIGSAVLVLAAGALVGTIGLLWASVRTLSGDAPLAEGFGTQTAERGEVNALFDEKRRALRALKDLEAEHALGKIDDEDYRSFVEKYRDEAKRIMREIDSAVVPYRDKAEEMARAYLEKRGLGREAAYREPAEATPGEVDDEDAKGASEEAAPERVTCKACEASNEWDATFCTAVRRSSMRKKRATEKSDVSP